jgi:NET1-associated nuclear protein 1 (U3 small nucleolar RNA-associated protein 17)
LLESALRRRQLAGRPIARVDLRKKAELEYKHQMTCVKFTLLHWHAHGVLSLAITPDCGFLLSGGEESVVVCWHLPINNVKKMIPRVGAPIVNIACSLDGMIYILGLLSNVIKAVNVISSQTLHVFRGLMHSLLFSFSFLSFFFVEFCFCSG